MKIIDLLNKIANGEHLIIKDGINKYEYDSAENDYITGMGYNYEHYFSNIGNILEYLNDEIEIIEEPKKIEKIECDVEAWFTPSQADIEIIKKVNQIINYINHKENK